MDPFALLASGVKFDKSKVPKHLSTKAQANPIAQPLPELPAAAAAAGQQQQLSKKQKKRKRAQAAADQVHGKYHAAEGDGISLFGGSTQQQQQQQQQEVELPKVHTNDPYEEANLIRKSLRIKVKGSDIPHPLKHWADLAKPTKHSHHHQQQQPQLQQQQQHEQQDEQPPPKHKKHKPDARTTGFSGAGGGGSSSSSSAVPNPDVAICGRKLLSHLEEHGWLNPTPIQRQAVPALLQRREVLAVAPTGSGKTLAFLLPMMALLSQAKQQHEQQQQQQQQGEQQQQQGSEVWPDAPKALVLSPTHELSSQTARVLKMLLPGSGLRCCLLSKKSEGTTDFSKVDVLIANPLRLKGLVEEGKVDLSKVSYLVLDEADKLLALGFTEQIDALLAAATHPHITRALFSATLPDKVESLARSVLRDPLHITVGEKNTAQSLVTQRLMFVGRSDGGKLLTLRQLLSGSSGVAADGSSIGGLLPPILVFVATKARAKVLHRELLYDGLHVDSISGDQSASLRAAAVENFRAGKTWVLIATDLIGRGMDFAGVNTVINYDFPSTPADYIHRVGRTGRGGHAGAAITFFSEEDAPKLRSVAHLITQAGSKVPDWMLHLTKQRDRKREQMRQRHRQQRQQQQQGSSNGKQQQQQQLDHSLLLEEDHEDEQETGKATEGGPHGRNKKHAAAAAAAGGSSKLTMKTKSGKAAQQQQQQPPQKRKKLWKGKQHGSSDTAAAAAAGVQKKQRAKGWMAKP